MRRWSAAFVALGAALAFGAPPLRAEVAPNDTRAAALRAYEAALAERKLAAAVPLSRERLQTELVTIEDKVLAGRRDEAIADLVYLIESPRFAPFERSEEGGAALFLLGDSLGRAGAYEPARGYLARLLRGAPAGVWYRRSVASLVDLALESETPELFAKQLSSIPQTAPASVLGDVEYLQGRIAERGGDSAGALAAYGRVSEQSRFWAQAVYLAGVLEVRNNRLAKAEALFCRVADPKRTPPSAALFGGSDFFRIRDLARLGLGRVAHEQYRFDDARYYYYLVPSDSERLPEALYETATTRYEAKDYAGARQAMDELNRLAVEHAYTDEAYLLDAYIELAGCRFPSADRKLRAFLTRYEPAQQAARRLLSDPGAMRRLVDSVRRAQDPAGAQLGIPEATARSLGMLLRVDADYGRAARRLAQLDHQVHGLRGAVADLDEASKRVTGSKANSRLQPHSGAALGQRPTDKLSRVESQIAEIKRLLREAEGRDVQKRGELDALKGELATLEVAARAGRVALGAGLPNTPASATDLAGILAADRQRAEQLQREAVALRAAVEAQQLTLARAAFERLDKRLTRLLNRARLGRIETVLGRKRALEIEVEALSSGLLPHTIVDSLKPERYLGDDEEYWPFEGEDWADEYVGGEGLR